MGAEPRGRSGEEGAPKSGASCPACSKELDPLRAGQVAILGGQFLYFCNQRCKADHFQVISSRLTIDALTADPPAVREAQESGVTFVPRVDGQRAPVSGIARESVPTLPEPTETPPPVALDSEPAPTTLRSPDSTGPRAAASSAVASDEVTAPPPLTFETEAAPVEPTWTAPLALTPREAKRGPSRLPSADRVFEIFTYAGIACGALAWAVALAGASAAALRLPLAGVAAAMLVARGVRGKKDQAHPHPLVALAPPLLALAVAVWARAAHHASAGSIASFSGLGCAATLVMMTMLERARLPLDAARERIARALAGDVRVVKSGETTGELVPAAQVKAGEQVLVEAGEIIGVDGLVAAGDAVVSPWLDAPSEIKKKEGDAVVAGARVISGRLRLMTTWAAQDRAWMRLSTSPAHRMDVAAPLARGARLIVERGTLAAAALVAAATYANNGSPIEVVAAASAAAMAFGAWTVAVVVSMHHARAQGEALSHGVVFKDPNAFHEAGGSDVAVLCARGTVLMGEPEIVALEPIASLDAPRVLALAAGAETASNHPFASAICRAARARGVRMENVRNATEHAGLGVTALSASGERLVVGSRALLLQERVSVALADARVSELEAQGRSVLLVALSGKLVGLVALQDGLRAGARAAVQRLHDARIEPVLLSGEARETCETIGRALDIEHIRPEVLPADRGAEIRALSEGGHVVAALGHPETDDAALGAADVSVAMCAAGATPGEWAVALASDDVRDAALALCLAHTARDRSRVALAVGLSPGLVAALLIGFGIAPLFVAPLAALAGGLAAFTHARR
jgi:cation transport ATPase